MSVVCSGGCTCPPLDMDAHWDEKHSTTGMSDWTVLSAGDGAQCRVRLEAGAYTPPLFGST